VAEARRPQSAEMHAGPGFRIRTHDTVVPDGAVESFRAYPTPDVSDLLNRLYTMSTAISSLTENLSVVGPACTVKVFPGDNLMVHKAHDLVQPGDVLVIDASSSMMTAVLGDLICTKARHRGVAGVIVDGLVRDLPAIKALGDFPVFARGVTPLGPLHRGPGEVNYPVSCGGIVVHPGDLIVGDGNGVVVVPTESIEELLTRLDARRRADAEYTAAVARGQFSNSWVDEVLKSGGMDLALGRE
jgi:RraA family protein